MRIGIFADTHDRIPHIVQAVSRFNDANVDLVLFAGDLVSTIALPPLRRLKAPLVACYGDNEGNKVGLQSGFRILGMLAEPPVTITADDGTRIAIAHMKRQLESASLEFDVGVIGHTHRPRIERDKRGRLLINPGETSGWSFGRATIAFLETSSYEAYIEELFEVQPLG